MDEDENWRRAWSGRPHRRMSNPPKLSTGVQVAFVSATISLDPPEHVARMPPRPSDCPVCGAAADQRNAQAASLHRNFEGGFNYGQSVWVHAECFLACLPTDAPPPIPL